MNTLQNIWKWIDHNRFTAIATLAALALWIFALGCEVKTMSPVTGNKINIRQLQVEYNNMLEQFSYAAEDIELKTQKQEKVKNILLALASGNVTNYSGFIQLLITGGILGVGLDNSRKNAIIAGMKLKDKSS